MSLPAAAAAAAVAVMPEYIVIEEEGVIEY